MPLIMG